MTAIERNINSRVKRETKRLEYANLSIVKHQTALATDTLTIGQRMHHRVSLALRELDRYNAQSALDILSKAQTWEDYRAVMDFNEQVYHDREASRKIFLAGYEWAVEQYKAKGDNANAAKMQKQVKHWSTSYEEVSE